MANDKSIFKKLSCPACKTWEADATGKRKGECRKCGATLILSDNWHCRLTRAGKTTVKSVSSRRNEVVDYLHAAKDAIRRKALMPGEEQDITWADAKKVFEAWYAGLECEKTRAFYKTNMKALERIVVDDDGTTFPNLTLQEIEPKHLATFKARRLTEVSPKTVNSEMGTLNRIYALMKETHSIRTYPLLHAAHTDLQNVKAPDPNNEKTRFLDLPEVGKLLAACTEPHVKLIIIIGIKTMLRKMNILALRRSQIDLESHQIVIPRAQMKAKASSRPPHVVPIDLELETLLKRWMLENRTFDYLFPSPKNPRTHIKSIAKGVNGALERAGVNKGVTDRRDKITFNVATRHTGATLLMQQPDADIYAVSKLLDHSNVTITDRKYVKKVNEKLHRVVNQMWDKNKLENGPENKAKNNR